MPPPRTSADPLDDPTLQALMSPSLLALARRGELRRYRRGTLLIEEGDHGDTLFLIVSGRLRAYSAHPTSGREFTYGIYGPGEYVGEMSLDDGRRSANVDTLEASRCVVITRRTLMAHVEQDPSFAFELLAKVIRRARAATLSAGAMALNDVYGRLRTWLEVKAVGQPGGRDRHDTWPRIVHDLPTQRELGNQLGCTREMVSKLLSDLKRGGWIESSGTDLLLLRAPPPRW